MSTAMRAYYYGNTGPLGKCYSGGINSAEPRYAKSK
jgi:hypothetical protein